MKELIQRLRAQALTDRDEATDWGACAVLLDGDEAELAIVAAHHAGLALDLEAAADALERQQAENALVMLAVADPICPENSPRTAEEAVTEIHTMRELIRRGIEGWDANDFVLAMAIAGEEWDGTDPEVPHADPR
jgi:hypothetical protein